VDSRDAYTKLKHNLLSHFFPHVDEEVILDKIQRYLISIGKFPDLKQAKRVWKTILQTAEYDNSASPYNAETIKSIREYAADLFSYGHQMGFHHEHNDLWEGDISNSDAYWYIVNPSVLSDDSDEVLTPINAVKTTLIMSEVDATRLLNALNSEGFACPITLDKWKLAFSGVPLDELEGHPLADAVKPVDNKTRLNQEQFSYLIKQLVDGGAITHNNSNLNTTFEALTGWSHTITSYAGSFASNKKPKGTNLVVKPFLDSIIASFTAL